MKTYNTSEIIALAFAAHRINKGFVKDTYRYSENENDTRFANKELLRYHFMKKEEFVPNDFVDFVIVDEDKQNAVDSIKYLNREYSLQVMAGTLTGFIDTLLKTINSETVNKNDFGVLAYLPKIFFERKEKKELKSHLKSFTESKFIGQIGTSIEGKFVINEIHFVQKFGCHVVNGSIENNLVSFFKEFSAGKEIPKVGDVLNIKAKVKRHGENFITKLPETQLNYVRIK